MRGSEIKQNICVWLRHLKQNYLLGYSFSKQSCCIDHINSVENELWYPKLGCTIDDEIRKCCNLILKIKKCEKILKPLQKAYGTSHKTM